MSDLRPAPFFIGDDLALDFLNSVATPFGRAIEWLENGHDLIAWLERARAVPADIAAHFRKGAGSRAFDGVAAEARELREWFREFVGGHAGQPLRERDLRELAPLNELLARDRAFRQIMIADRGERNDHPRSGPCAGKCSAAGTIPKRCCYQLPKQWVTSSAKRISRWCANARGPPAPYGSWTSARRTRDAGAAWRCAATGRRRRRIAPARDQVWTGLATDR